MFRVFNHTADIGLLVEGKSKEELFTESAAGMFNIIAGGKLSNKLKVRKSLRAIAKQSRDCHPCFRRGRLAIAPRNDTFCQFKVSGTTLEELLVDFLNELLYLSEKKKAIFAQFKIKIEKIENRICLKAQIKKNDQIPRREIKAATYNDLRIERENNLWQARIIFDI